MREVLRRRERRRIWMRALVLSLRGEQRCAAPLQFGHRCADLVAPAFDRVAGRRLRYRPGDAERGRRKQRTAQGLGVWCAARGECAQPLVRGVEGLCRRVGAIGQLGEVDARIGRARRGEVASVTRPGAREDLTQGSGHDEHLRPAHHVGTPLLGAPRRQPRNGVLGHAGGALAVHRVQQPVGDVAVVAGGPVDDVECAQPELGERPLAHRRCGLRVGVRPLDTGAHRPGIGQAAAQPALEDGLGRRARRPGTRIGGPAVVGARRQHRRAQHRDALGERRSRARCPRHVELGRQVELRDRVGRSRRALRIPCTSWWTASAVAASATASTAPARLASAASSCSPSAEPTAGRVEPGAPSGSVVASHTPRSRPVR